ncbi:glycosyl transferase [Streptococcus sp. KCJ4932]|uniref:glycosyltransferase n=1 Tax=Streptococcus sp. KCJ4932 TaxID=2545465 RepID=UPI0010548F80|nr:glycosyltransferase [Streptococcus sp. KCJ4932]TDE68818.1 glycosyl transferase [Streptococcus sp. KCJ4932]
MIFVTVGSRNYPFNRLFKKIDELYDNGILTEPMFAQIGTSTYIPKNFEYQDFISTDEFVKKVSEADIVVTHGASGSIMKALNAGKKVIAVTRLEKYGEHINDHQIQNNEAFSSNGYVLMPYLELKNLGDCFKKIFDRTDNLIPWENKDPMAIINMIDDVIKENW